MFRELVDVRCRDLTGDPPLMVAAMRKKRNTHDKAPMARPCPYPPGGRQWWTQ